jgi:epoxyqueuosine reductase
MNTMNDLSDRLKQQARELGFDLVGIAPATEADGIDRLHEWLARGFAGRMDYMHRHAEARRHPESILPQVRSIIMVAMNYKPAEVGTEPGAGRIARYARGADYHDVLRERLRALLAWLQEQRPDCRGRGVVDTAPLLERDFARRAGLGWFGKNTMLLNRRLGSYFFLGALLVDIALPADSPHLGAHCGSCTACLDACPTDAFRGQGWLDSRRCISYLTIELRDSVPRELRSGVGEWLFGCDVCQEVCPWNRKAPAGREPALAPRPELERIDPQELLQLSGEAFQERFRGTALLRSKRGGLLRNAALVLGNTAGAEALPALRRALDDPERMVREAAAWAIEAIEQRTRGGLTKTEPWHS